ncbi:MAG: phosphate ABC transporter substrate-binding protein PstS [Cyanobium sp.]
MTFAKKALSLGVIAGLASGLAATAAGTLNGAGATFPAPFYQSAFAALAGQGQKVNYQSVGSGAGVRQYIRGTVDFGATDEPIKTSDIAKVKRGVIQFPVVGGTIAVAYNKSDCPALKLTQKQVVDIFMGRITTWDALKCGKGPLSVAHRSDGSGTTFAFTSSLNSFGQGWSLGAAKSVSWPVGVGGKGNEGVAGVITNTPGAIGYLNQAYVKGPIKAAALQNRSGAFVKPGLASGRAALAGIDLDANLAGENPNPAGAGAYPISTLTWILAYQNGNGLKAGAIRKALLYLLSPQAQNRADDLGYVPLNQATSAAARKAVAKIGP